MDEFLQSIAKGIKERLGSAFLFNFILSWIVYMVYKLYELTDEEIKIVEGE
jgi:hypothetical protein